MTLSTAIAFVLAQSGTHDFRCDATRLETVLTQLRDLTGENMAAGGKLANEPVIVDVTGRTAQEIRDALAACLEATWSKQGERWVLLRSAAKEAELKSAHEASVAAEIGKAVQKLIADRPKNEWSAQEVVQAVEAERKFREKLIGQFSANLPEGARATVISSSGPKGPAGIVLDAALKALSPARLAKMGKGSRVAFSTSRTNRQESLAGDISSAVQRFVAAHNAVVSTANSMPELDERVKFEGTLDLNAKPVANVGKVIVGVERDFTGSVFSVEATIYGPDMTVLGKSSASFGVTPEDATEAAPSGGRHKWSGRANEIATALQQAFRTDDSSRGSISLATNGMFLSIGSDDIGATTEFTADTWLALTSPATVDPLALFVGEAVADWCKGRKPNYVARVPDSMFGQTMVGMQTPETSLSQIGALTQARCTVDEGGEIMVVKPRDSYQTETERYNRTALQTLLRAAAGKHYLTLDEQLAYVQATNQRSVRTGMDMVCLALVAPDGATSLVTHSTTSYWLMRVLAASGVPTGMFRAGDSSVRLGSLMPAQVSAVEQAVFNKAMGPRLTGEGTMVAITVDQGEEPRRATASDLDPTEAFPNGLPADMELNLTVADHDAVLATVPKSRVARMFTAEGLGTYLALLGTPEIINEMPNLAQYSAYQPATMRMLEGTVAGKSQLLNSSVTDGKTLPGAAVTLAQLPQSFGDTVKAAEAEAKKNQMSFGPRRTNGPIKP